MIDLRSDTVTKPTPAMLEAMMNAEVGDDVFQDDPSVNALEAQAAEMFRVEAAIFCPSGTMTNQIALRIHTQPQDEVICDRLSHIYNYEGGGIAYNSLISVRLLEGDRGRIHPEQIEGNINPDDVHFPATRLVSLENTVNKGGGCCYSLSQLREIKSVCEKYGLALHLDGARLFNAIVAKSDSPKEYGQLFDTISICLSKGLGAPVGSLLLGSQTLIKKARRVRKVLGGGMRQAGFLAAAGSYALSHHVERLAEDHSRAKQLGETLDVLSWVEEVFPVETNIVVARLQSPLNANAVLSKLEEMGIGAVPFGKDQVRFVLHLDITDAMLSEVQEKARKLVF